MPGAGILPVAVYKNKIYFLFGKENKHNDTPGWCDFGGGIERGETFVETSLRELEEETCGFISKEEIIDSIENNGS
jgi:ADP-ribose pyrophosphatase YjhB (NUDIX family)